MFTWACKGRNLIYRNTCQFLEELGPEQESFQQRFAHLCRREMQGRSSMFVTDVDVGDAGLQQPRQRLRVVGVGRQTDLPLNDARF